MKIQTASLLIGITTGKCIRYQLRYDLGFRRDERTCISLVGSDKNCTFASKQGHCNIDRIQFTVEYQENLKKKKKLGNSEEVVILEDVKVTTKIGERTDMSILTQEENFFEDNRLHWLYRKTEACV